VSHKSRGIRAAHLAKHPEVKRLFDLGMSDAQIAEALSMTPTGVRGVRLRNGWKRPKAMPPQMKPKVDDEYLTREFNETIVVPQRAKDFDEVHRQVERIARAAQVDPHTVRRRLRKLDLLETDTRRQAKSPEQWARALELLQDGLPYAEVARETGFKSTSHMRKKYPGLGVRPEDQGTFLAAKRLERSLGL
jgi:AraC-like DNA-binding protein